jgi:ribosomal protein S18 acetylase RimI-like enzyme
VIVRIDEANYPAFADMLYWRATGQERSPAGTPLPERYRSELNHPGLQVYAYETEGRFVGWISLAYIPKVSRCHGHVYVDELWVAPEFRRRGIAAKLMGEADRLCKELDASGIRLYVNTENPGARALYEKCGFTADGTAHWMSK